MVQAGAPCATSARGRSCRRGARPALPRPRSARRLAVAWAVAGRKRGKGERAGRDRLRRREPPAVKAHGQLAFGQGHRDLLERVAHRRAARGRLLGDRCQPPRCQKARRWGLASHVGFGPAKRTAPERLHAAVAVARTHPRSSTTAAVSVVAETRASDEACRIRDLLKQSLPMSAALQVLVNALRLARATTEMSPIHSCGSRRSRRRKHSPSDASFPHRSRKSASHLEYSCCRGSCVP